MNDLVTDSPNLPPNDFVLAKEIADRLHKHYPNHLWAVTVDGRQGIATIRNLSLSGEWGYLIKLPPIYSASQLMKEIMRAGGELLERYKVSRGHMQEDEIANLPTDFSGRHLAELD